MYIMWQTTKRTTKLYFLFKFNVMKRISVELTDQQENSLSKQIETALIDNVDFVLALVNVNLDFDYGSGCHSKPQRQKLEKEDLVAFVHEEHMYAIWECGLEVYNNTSVVELLFDLYTNYMADRYPEYRPQEDPTLKELGRELPKWLK